MNKLLIASTAIIFLAAGPAAAVDAELTATFNDNFSAVYLCSDSSKNLRFSPLGDELYSQLPEENPDVEKDTSKNDFDAPCSKWFELGFLEKIITGPHITERTLVYKDSAAMDTASNLINSGINTTEQLVERGLVACVAYPLSGVAFRDQGIMWSVIELTTGGSKGCVGVISSHYYSVN